MLRYYVYHNPKYEYNKTISSIEELCDINDVILLPEKSYLLRIPVMQKYDGYAIVLSSALLLRQKVDIQSFKFDDNLGITNKKRNMFILNCNCNYAKEILTNRKMIYSPMRSIDVQNLNLQVNNILNNYVDVKDNQEDIFFGQVKHKE